MLKTHKKIKISSFLFFLEDQNLVWNQKINQIILSQMIMIKCLENVR